MIWFWGVLCALALVALFFPFIFWIDFSVDFKGVTVGVRFFKKEVYTYTKHFKKEKSSEEENVSVDDEVEATASAPAPKVEKAEPPKTEKPVEKQDAPKPVDKQEPLKKEEPKASEEKPSGEKTSEEKPAEVKLPDEKLLSEKPAEEKPTDEKKSGEEKQPEDEKEEKRSLTDEEFWTLLLTPEFDTRAWWAVRHALSALFRLFRIRFVDCFVEGIRFQEYENMGYAAALNGFLKSFPYIGAWDFRMDWTRDHEPKAEGHVRASLNLCRVLGLIVTILFFGGIVAFTFWRRRARILKTGELPELGFIRSKIVKMMSEED